MHGFVCRTLSLRGPPHFLRVYMFIRTSPTIPARVPRGASINNPAAQVGRMDPGDPLMNVQVELLPMRSLGNAQRSQHETAFLAFSGMYVFSFAIDSFPGLSLTVVSSDILDGLD